ncbi:MAG: manno-octulosonate cytidylyltransferase [Pseudobdellovibrionaceae bacterium]|jgi:3-deoxy-manno-octulosonate cytidylyltransferase (CMP-KDO synthetase)|nr:manno-octulosonate cytidylyltransferase [Pseudobdellovibrionaceae bacterium]
MKTAIIIPARYGSTRFPGKPLALLAGKAVLDRVYEVAQSAAVTNTTIHVATDDARIRDHCTQQNIPVLMTPETCATGTDRAMAAIAQMDDKPDFIINLQGDAPLTPSDFVRALIEEASNNKSADIITPVTQLAWTELDTLRDHKKQTPFSGTTAIIDLSGRALWFSKNIIPAIRKEDRSAPLSPVYRHIGLYGYKRAALEKYVTLPASRYEELEGLEQLRALENGMTIQTVLVDYKGRPAMTGIDSPEDLERAENLLSK